MTLYGKVEIPVVTNNNKMMVMRWINKNKVMRVRTMSGINKGRMSSNNKMLVK